MKLGDRSSWMIHGVVPHGAPEPEAAPRHVRVDFGGAVGLLSAGHVSESANPRSPADRATYALEDEAAAALAHNDLLIAYALVTDVVPLRYGAAVTGPSAALSRLKAGRTHYLRALRRVSGAVEYVLRVTASSPVGAVRDVMVSGRPGFGAPRARREGRDALGPVRMACLGEIAMAASTVTRETVSLPLGGDRLLDLALLVPHGRVDDLVPFAERSRGMAAACGLQMSLVGPWPAYSFTRAPGA